MDVAISTIEQLRKENEEMKNRQTLNAKALMSAYKNLYRELYALCFAITGSEISAREALMDTMIETGARFNRAKAVSCARGRALKYEPVENMRNSFLEDDADIFLQETAAARRAVVLVRGCGLTATQAAGRTGMKSGQVAQALERARAAMPGRSAEEKGRQLDRRCARELKEFDGAPDPTVFARALENRLAVQEEKSGILSGGRKLISNATAILMLLLIGFMIWVGAILMNYFRETAQTSAQNQTTISEESDAAVQGSD